MAEWRIWYDGGKTFSDEDGTPQEAPGWGVEIIVQADDVTGRYICDNRDFYIYRKGKWYGVDLFGLMDYLVNELGVVKVGRLISNQEYTELYRKSEADESIQPRSHRLLKERAP